MEAYDFGDGRGLVPARRHENGGGWVALGTWVHEDAYVGPDAVVFGGAYVGKDGSVSGESRIGGYATILSSVSDSTILAGHIDRWVYSAEIDVDPATGVATYAGGRVAGFLWSAYTARGGGAILNFGCTRLTFDEWDAADHDAIALQHGYDPARYGALTRHLVAGLRALWGIPCAS